MVFRTDQLLERSEQVTLCLGIIMGELQVKCGR